MTDMDEPDRSSKPPREADDQPPPSAGAGPRLRSIETEFFDASGQITTTELTNLRDLTVRVLDQLPNAGSVRVRIVNDDEMIEAHRKYCQLATTTDVLTFDLAQHETDLSTKTLDTDLIVCIDEAQRQAHNRSHSRIHELLLYILHGVLHCLGHDDHTDEDFARMHDQEDKLLTNAGIGAIFHNTQRNTQETTP